MSKIPNERINPNPKYHLFFLFGYFAHRAAAAGLANCAAQTIGCPCLLCCALVAGGDSACTTIASQRTEPSHVCSFLLPLFFSLISFLYHPHRNYEDFDQGWSLEEHRG